MARVVVYRLMVAVVALAGTYALAGTIEKRSNDVGLPPRQ